MDNSKAYEAWIDKAIEGHEGLYGVQMKLEMPAEFTVRCNLFPTTKRNALACYRAVAAVMGDDETQWGDTVDIALFRSYGASNDN